jgi:hypothetical protein
MVGRNWLLPDRKDLLGYKELQAQLDLRGHQAQVELVEISMVVHLVQIMEALPQLMVEACNGNPNSTSAWDRLCMDCI